MTTTPSTRSPIGSTQGSWRGCRCSTPRDFIRSRVSDRPTRYGESREAARFLGEAPHRELRRGSTPTLELLGPSWHAAFAGDLISNRYTATPGRRLRRSPRLTTPRTRSAGQVDLALLARQVRRERSPPDSRGLPRRKSPSPCGTVNSTSPNWPTTSPLRRCLALALCHEIHELEERIAVSLKALDPLGISDDVGARGVATVNGAQILARLGDPNRFCSLAGAKSYSGLVPSLSASGVHGRNGGPTKSGDAPLREALFMAADWARRVDPTLAQRYHRLMVTEGKHHNSALCHVSATLLTRIISCWRSGTPYVIRDLDGTPLTKEQGREDRRAALQRPRSHPDSTPNPTTKGTSRRIKESPGAPSIDSSQERG